MAARLQMPQKMTLWVKPNSSGHFTFLSSFIYYFLPRSANRASGNTSVITGIRTDNSATGGWNTPTQDIINAYEPGDTLRMKAAIGIAEGTYNQSYLFTFSASKSIINYT